jgi:hypothetical protein
LPALPLPERPTNTAPQAYSGRVKKSSDRHRIIGIRDKISAVRNGLCAVPQLFVPFRGSLCRSAAGERRYGTPTHNSRAVPRPEGTTDNSPASSVLGRREPWHSSSSRQGRLNPGTAARPSIVLLGQAASRRLPDPATARFRSPHPLAEDKGEGSCQPSPARRCAAKQPWRGLKCLPDEMSKDNQDQSDHRDRQTSPGHLFQVRDGLSESMRQVSHTYLLHCLHTTNRASGITSLSSWPPC